MPGVLEQANVLINHNMVAPAGSTPTGEMHLGIYPVYRRMVTRGRVVPVKNENGEILFHKRNGVITERQVTTREVWEEAQEFVLMPVGNGQTEIVHNFRPAADEEIRRQRAEANAPDRLAERLSRLEAGMAALGVSPEDLEKAIDASKAAPEPGEPRGARGK